MLPEISVEIIDMQNDRFRVVIEDNGPGIIEKQIPNIFAKLLYGSKFHSMKQSRGQQGIGISAAVMYSQLTTGKSARITSKIGAGHPAHYYELKVDTQHNKPDIEKDEEIQWKKEHGTRIEMDIEATYQGGVQSVDEYLKQTAITNPHATIIYTNPKAEQIIFPRAIETMPKESKSIKPHPHGVELGLMINLLKLTESRTLQSFLCSEFSRVGNNTAKQICENSALLPTSKPNEMSREQAEQLIKGLQKTKLIAPPSDCISPIGKEALEKGLRKEVNAEFYASVSRPPSVYRGNPFVIEAAIAYGGVQESESPVRIFRYANRVPLLFQQGACAVTRSVINTAWRSYGLSQSQGSIPIGPCTIVTHIASVWVPFTSESKEAIAHYPEIIKETKLALQECGRLLSSYIRKKKSIHAESQKRSYIETYIPHVASALRELLELKEIDETKAKECLKEILEKHRGKLENIKFDPNANTEYEGDDSEEDESQEGSDKNEEAGELE